MKKILATFIITLFFWNCAGSLYNPYMEDIYGEKKNLIQGGAVLLEIREDPNDTDIYSFRIIENIAMSNREREKNRIKTILQYYTDFCSKNNYIGLEELNVEYEQKFNTGWFWHKIKFSRESNQIKLIKDYSNNRNMIDEMMPYVETMTKTLAEYYIGYKEYEYDVSGYGPDGQFITGKINAYKHNDDVDGFLILDDGSEVSFDGEWVGKGLIEGYDENGDYHQLEVD